MFAASKNIHATAGQTLSLPCSTPEGPVEWRKNEFLIYSKGIIRDPSYYIVLAAHQFDLHIKNISLNDEGAFKCFRDHSTAAWMKYIVTVAAGNFLLSLNISTSIVSSLEQDIECSWIILPQTVVLLIRTQLNFHIVLMCAIFAGGEGFVMSGHWLQIKRARGLTK